MEKNTASWLIIAAFVSQLVGDYPIFHRQEAYQTINQYPKKQQSMYADEVVENICSLGNNYELSFHLLTG